MALAYNIYRNDGMGGPVDFSTPFATVAAPPLDLGTPAAGSHWRYVVRTYDDAAELEEWNVDEVELVLDASGNDATARPAAVRGLSATASGTTSALVLWAPGVAPGADVPTGYRAWVVASPGPIDYGDPPAATVPHGSGESHFRATLSGLPAGATRLVGVKAYNASGESDASEVAVTTPAAAPAAPTGLSGSAS